MVVTDDLLIGEETGYKVCDASRAPEDPHYEFFLKVILLFMQGDYPAQGKASGMMHAGGYACHWCLHKAENIKGVSRMVSGDYGAYLPLLHPKRHAGLPAEPPGRLHAATCRDALKNQLSRDRRVQLEACEVEEKDKDENIKGVKEWCPLVKLQLFDVIWDFVPDMMHMVQGLLKTYIVKTMLGKRKVKEPKPLTTDGFEGAELDRRKGLNAQAAKDYATAAKVDYQYLLA